MALLGEIAETILVTFIILFFVVSLLHVLRNRVRPPIVVSTDNVFIRSEDGQVIALTGHQRRAVLEAIFSDAAKAVTDQDVKPKRKKKRKQRRPKDDAPIPAVEIPYSTTNEQRHDRDVEEGSLSEEEEDVIIHLSPQNGKHIIEMSTLSAKESIDVDDYDQDKQAVSIEAATIRSILRRRSSDDQADHDHDDADKHDDVDEQDGDNDHGAQLDDEANDDEEEEDQDDRHILSTVLSEETAPMDNINSGSREQNYDDIDMSSVSYDPYHGGSSIMQSIAREDDTPTHHQESDVGSIDDGGMSIGDLCEAIPDAALLQSAMSIVSRDSFVTVTSEYTFDDESTTENMCSICLCGYSTGDIVIASKHCTHMFHKDCILSWLDKHDDCPVCREGMMTDTEVSQAVQNVVKPTLVRQRTPVTSNTTSTPSSRGQLPSLSQSMVSATIRHLPPRPTSSQQRR